MPRQYITPADFKNTPVGVGTAIYLAQLPTGQLDEMCFAASTRADTYTNRLLQAPQATTIGTGGIALGGTVLPLASVLSIPEQQSNVELLAVLDTGANQETLPVAPGSGLVTNVALGNPYAGTCTLLSPTVYAHSAGATVSFLYREIRPLGRSASGGGTGPYGRVSSYRVALSCYPLIGTLTAIEMDATGGGVWVELPLTAVSMDPIQGRYSLPGDVYGLTGAIIRTTYLGGYSQVPYDIRKAISYYVADDLHFMVNPWMSVQRALGKSSEFFVPRMEKHKTGMTTQAEMLLLPYERVR